MAMTDQQKLRITIATVGTAIVGALIFCGLMRGCKWGCTDCDEHESEPKRADSVYVIEKEKKPCPDMEFDVYDKDRRSSGVIWWGEAKNPGKTGGKKVKEKTIVQPEPVIEPKPEPEVVKKHGGFVITYQTPCNGL